MNSDECDAVANLLFNSLDTHTLLLDHIFPSYFHQTAEYIAELSCNLDT